MFEFVSRHAGISTTLIAATLFVLPAAAEMRLSSPDISEGQKLGSAQVLAGMGCSGRNISPALSWIGVPAGTESFIVTMYDPDAPTGSGFWHWSVFNIPGDAKGLETGRLPPGAIAARNDFSQNSYAGACPPEGQNHRYIVSVFAMPDARLPIDETASGALIGFFATTGALESASITAKYGR